MTSNSSPKLTSEQSVALAAHDRSVSLAAGAGCGKTFVLTERFLSYLDPAVLEPTAELSELVAITFTDAAAREMRDRVRRRCFQRQQQATQPEEKQSWQNLIRAMDVAQISTIHSFCATLLRTHAAEAGVDPRFELLDGPATELLRLQTLDDRLRQLLIERDERLIELATHFDLRNLRDTLATLLGENSQPVIDKWLAASTKGLIETWREYHAKTLVPAAVESLWNAEPIVALRSICENANATKDKLKVHLNELLGVLISPPDNAHALVATDQLRGLAQTRSICTAKDWEDKFDYENYRDTCKAVRDLIDRSPLRLPLDAEQLEQTASLGLDLLHLVADVTANYEQAKRDRNVLEFDDLLAKTHRLLTDDQFSVVRKSFNKSMRLLMVDEFQDTDPLQVAIVRALCGGESIGQGLFVVGDFKQSIYRFRGAQPQVSSQLRSSLPAESRLSLTTNFRSQPAILDFVNALFCDAFGQEEYEPLSASRSQTAPTPAVEFLWAAENEKTEQDDIVRQLSQAQMSRMQEARFIARRLCQLLDSGEEMVVDAQTNQPRCLQLGDIAILLRSLSDVNIYEEAFREYELDYYLAGGHAFYAQQEIYDVLHLLRTVASPADELSLAGALRSPMFALEDEILFWLKKLEGSLNAGIFSTELTSQLTDEQTAKVQRAASTIQHLRKIKDQVMVTDLLNEAIARTGYDAILQCEFLGQRKLANVQKLIDQARSFDRTNPGDLDGFITQLSEFVVRAPKEPLAASRAEGDVIRIMTIHYAKGLEFPLVVVPDLNRKSPPTVRSPILDEELGPLVPPEKTGTKEEYCVGWNMYQFAEREQDLEERIRLLYVATTRAADYLILASSVQDLHKDLEHPSTEWLKFLGQRFDLLSGECLAELPVGYTNPAVLITSKEPHTDRKPSGKSRGTDLQKMIEKTVALAQAGKGVVPETVAAIPVDTSARKRFSFSRLSGQLKREDRQSQQLHEHSNTSSLLDPRGLGTLVHAVLERIDFRTENDVKGLCEYLAPLHLETDWQEAAESASAMIRNFLASERAKQLAAAQVLRAEAEFLLPWTMQQSSYEGHFLQGYIDCMYQDSRGDWHLVDYKSNHVDAAGVPKAAEQYELQMFVYSLACERALGCTPVESVLCFLHSATEFRFEWDKKTRAKLITQLDAAITDQLSPAH